MKRMLVLASLVTTVGFFTYLGSTTTIYARTNEASSDGARINSALPDGPPPQTAKVIAQEDGAKAYAAHCALCHGDNREGNLPGFPPLVGVSHHLTNQQITTNIRNGKGRMPAFTQAMLTDADLATLLHFLDGGQPMVETIAAGRPAAVKLPPLAEAGGVIFQQNCAFCHGRDTGGGETGPDLTRSQLVGADVGGDKISDVVHNGRAPKMPAFNFSAQETTSLAAYIHAMRALAVAKKGGRRGVDVTDFRTGSVDAGKQYFNGAGGCAKCHSATGDLAGVATRFEGLQLEERMLYPKGVKDTVTVTLPSGEILKGDVAYRDEFTIAMRDKTGQYRSWPTDKVKYEVVDPLKAHSDQFEKYTDEDIHNLMAYIQTLR